MSIGSRCHPATSRTPASGHIIPLNLRAVQNVRAVLKRLTALYPAPAIYRFASKMAQLAKALEISTAHFVNLHPESERLYHEALKSLPGGNTRTLLYTSPFPVFMKKGQGCELWDEDGNLYITI